MRLITYICLILSLFQTNMLRAGKTIYWFSAGIGSTNRIFDNNRFKGINLGLLTVPLYSSAPFGIKGIMLPTI